MLPNFKNYFRDSPSTPVVETVPSNTGFVSSDSGGRAKIPQASRPKAQNTKQKQYCNKLNKDFKSGPYKKYLFKKATSKQL